MSDDARPVLRVVAGGEPRDEELAALVAVVSALAAAGGERRDEAVPADRWRAAARSSSAWGRSGWMSDARRSALRRPL